MGSSRSHENELHQNRQISSHEELLDLFFEIQKRDHERKNANKTDAAVHAHNYEYINSSEGSPLTAGSTMEAQVAARLASSSFYGTSKPIMRYASKRNNADLLTFDVGKTDCDWLMTPPATPFNNSIDYTNDATLENSDLPLQLHALATVQEVGLKNFTQIPETSVFPNSPQVDKTFFRNFVATANSGHTSLSWENHVNNHANPAISSNSSNSTAKIIHITHGNDNKSYTISNKKPLSNSTHANSSDSSVKSSAKGYSTHVNSVPASKESSRITNQTSRFSELPSIITTLKTTSHPYKSTTVGSSSSASTTPRVDMTGNAKRSIVTNAPSRRPTTPTLSQNQSKPIANNDGGTRSTSIGRGAINIGSNTSASQSTNKLGKGSKSTSSSRAGSPQTARALPWEPSEMPGFSTEAPPNLRTTASNRSTSTTRSSRSTSTTRSSRSTSTSRQPTTPTNRNNSNNSTSRDTSRSTSASKVRSTSTSKSSDTKSKTDGMNAITLTTSRGSNKKGAFNNNVLGSRMVDKVIQARRVASSTSSIHSSASTSTTSSSLSPALPSASSSLSSLSLKSASSLSSLSISSTSSLSSLPSTLSSSSSFSSPPTSSTLPSCHNTQARSNESRSVHSESNGRLRHNKVMGKQSTSNTASISTSLFKDTNPGFNSSRLNQSSKTRPMQRNGEAHHSEMITPRMSELQAKPLKNTLQGEDTMNYARQSNVGTLQVEDTMNYTVQSNVGNAESKDVSKKPTPTKAKEVEKQHQKQQQQYQVSEESSDFSNELNAIMRQDSAHHQYGAFPSKDIIKVSNNVGNVESRNISKKPNTTIAKELVHRKQQQQYQMSEESSDFSNELNAIMRQDKAHYHGAFPSKDIIKVSNNWMLNSPDCSMRDDSVELMHLFRQGIERYEISESPLVCQHGAPGNCDKCNNVHGKGFKSTAEVWKAGPLSNNSRFSHKHPNELWKGTPF